MNFRDRAVYFVAVSGAGLIGAAVAGCGIAMAISLAALVISMMIAR